MPAALDTLYSVQIDPLLRNAVRRAFLNDGSAQIQCFPNFPLYFQQALVNLLIIRFYVHRKSIRRNVKRGNGSNQTAEVDFANEAFEILLRNIHSDVVWFQPALLRNEFIVSQ